MEDIVREAVHQAKQVVDDLKTICVAIADKAKGKLDIILLLAQQLTAKIRNLTPLMSQVSDLVRKAISEAKSAKTVLSQLRNAISNIQNDPSRNVEQSLLNQTDTVVKKVSDNVQKVGALEALLPLLLEKQYELIVKYDELDTLLKQDKSLADTQEMKDLKSEMDNLISVIYRVQDPESEASTS